MCCFGFLIGNGGGIGIDDDIGDIGDVGDVGNNNSDELFNDGDI